MPYPLLRPSSEKKHALLWSEWLRQELLAAVEHCHVVFTIPRLLRPLFRRRRELLIELGHAAAAAIEKTGQPGAVSGDRRQKVSHLPSEALGEHVPPSREARRP